jgi:predicted transcriptional regulator
MARLKKRKEETCSLFSLKGEFRLAKLSPRDVSVWTDEAEHLKKLVVETEHMYPRIGEWFTDKVLPGIKAENRYAYVAYEDNRPIASAILKLGDKSKLCHLKIHEDFQDQYLGQIFFTQITFEVLGYARELHFTLPESLWETKRSFFESLGFLSPQKSQRQYRSNDIELHCTAPVDLVRASLLERLPRLLKRFSVWGQSLAGDVMLSIKPKYASRILCGEKTIEVRRKFSANWRGSKAIIYASRPSSSIVGEALIGEVTRGKPDDIWSHFAKRIGCSRKEFDAYTAACAEISAIELDEVRPYTSPLSREEASTLVCDHLIPPQSYCTLKFEKNCGWSRAAAIATLLRGKPAAAKTGYKAETQS